MAALTPPRPPPLLSLCHRCHSPPIPTGVLGGQELGTEDLGLENNEVLNKPPSTLKFLH